MQMQIEAQMKTCVITIGNDRSTVTAFKIV